MKKEPRYCKWDGKLIPDDKRIDAIFCSPKCGWSYRNEKKRQRKPVPEKIDARRETNIMIIKGLMSREIYEIPMKSLDDFGFDFDCYDKIGEFDIATTGTQFFISTFSFTITGTIVKFKNQDDGRT